MKYAQGTWTLPTCSKRMTDEEYAERVGLKLPPSTWDGRLWAKVDKSQDCWEYPASGRYGLVWVPSLKRRVQATRAVWFLHTGEWPAKNLEVCHSCDNTKCVRPNHLFLGSHLENMRDCAGKGRTRGAKKKICPRGHAYEVGNLCASRKGWRRCKECHRETNRAHMRKIRNVAKNLSAVPENTPEADA